MKSDVFLSYSAADRASADALCHHLEASGIRCWIAPRDVPAGVDWPDAISEAIDSAAVFVVVFTTDTATSRHVKSEVRQAFDSEKVIVPIRLAPVKPTGGYDHLLGSSHWIDAFPDGLDCHADNIVRTIRAILAHDPAAHKTMTGPRPAHGVMERLLSRKPLLVMFGIVCVAGAIAVAVRYLLPICRPSASAVARDSGSRISNPPPKEFLLGTWECRKMELGEEVRILWSVNSDNTTTYRAYRAGQTDHIPGSRWSYADGLLYEEFESGATGRGIVKALDANSLELTIIDNDSLPYRGEKRIYRRVAFGTEKDAPQDGDAAALRPRQ